MFPLRVGRYNGETSQPSVQQPIGKLSKQPEPAIAKRSGVQSGVVIGFLLSRLGRVPKLLVLRLEKRVACFIQIPLLSIDHGVTLYSDFDLSLRDPPAEPSPVSSVLTTYGRAVAERPDRTVGRSAKNGAPYVVLCFPFPRARARSGGSCFCGTQGRTEPPQGSFRGGSVPIFFPPAGHGHHSRGFGSWIPSPRNWQDLDGIPKAWLFLG